MHLLMGVRLCAPPAEREPRGGPLGVKREPGLSTLLRRKSPATLAAREGGRLLARLGDGSIMRMRPLPPPRGPPNDPVTGRMFLGAPGACGCCRAG